MKNNIADIKEDIKKENDKLSSFFQIDVFKKTSDDLLKFKIIENEMRNYFKLNFEENEFEKYTNYLNDIKSYLISNFYEQESIKLEYILGLHAIIMKGLWKERNTSIGQLRKVACVNRGKMLLEKASITSFLSPKHVEDYMQNAIEDYNNNITKDKLTSIVNLLVDMWIYIHPFEDGNGKVCYILIDTLLRKHGFWPIFLSHENNKLFFRELLQEYTNTKNLKQAKINFYKIIFKIYSNYKIT